MEVAITVVGVAASIVQLAEAVAKLKRICGAVKDASTDLSDLVSDISVRAKQLKRSKQYFKKAPLLEDDLVSECIQHLEKALLAVNTVADEMQTRLNRHKMKGSMQFVLKSRQIQEMKQRLKDAQELMDRTERLIDRIERERTSTAQSLQLQYNNELLVQIFEQVKNTAQSHSTQQPSLPPLTPQLALESLKRTHLRDMGGVPRNREYKIALPRWLWSKILKVAFEHQQSSIGFTLRYYNIVSLKSDIFVAVRSGNVDSVRHLFAMGEASPFDVLSSGYSLLSAATITCNAHMCRLLISQGAEIGYVDHSGRSALHYLAARFNRLPWYVSGPDYEKVKQSSFELVELFADLVPHDDQGVDEFAAILKKPEYVSTMRLLLKKGLSNSSLLPLEDRAELIRETDWIDLIKDLLGQDLSVQQVFTYAGTHELPHRKYLEEFLRKSDDERRDWSWFIRELIAVDQSLMVEDFRQPMDVMTSIVGIALYHTASSNNVNDLFSDLPKKSNQRLHKHLLTLQTLGADLAILGQTEQYMFRQYGWSERYWNSEHSFEFCWRMTGLNTGPHVTDWKIWLAPDNREYEWAGQFWDWIENPELYMPGAFLEEDIW